MNERRCETKQEGEKEEEKGKRGTRKKRKQESFRPTYFTNNFFQRRRGGITTRIYLETLEVRPLFTVETIIVTFAMPVRARHSLDDGKLHRRRGIIEKKWQAFNVALGGREERKERKGKKPRSA